MRDTPELGQPLGIEHVKELLARITGDRRAGSELSVSQIHQVHEDPALQKALRDEVIRSVCAQEAVLPNLIPLLAPASLEAIHSDAPLQEKIQSDIRFAINHGGDIKYGYEECLSKESLGEIWRATMKKFQPMLTFPHLTYIPNRYARLLSEPKRKHLQSDTMAHLLHMIRAGREFSPILLSTLSEDNFEKVRVAVQAKMSNTKGEETLPPLFNEVATFSNQTREEMMFCEEVFWNIRHFRKLTEAEQQTITELSPSGLAYFRERIRSDIERRVSQYQYIPEPLLYLLRKSGKEAPQGVLVDFFSSLLDDAKHGITNDSKLKLAKEDYWGLLTPETQDELRHGPKFKEKALALALSQLQRGRSLSWQLGEFAFFHPFDQNSLTAEIMRSTLENSLLLFFKEKRRVRERVRAFVSELDDETVRRALLDKTLTPLGLKFHTELNSPLTDAFTVTGGFVAHEQNTCFVAPVAVNETMLGLCCELFNQTLGKTVVPTPGSDFSFLRGYIQVTLPQRLSNEYCAVGTVAYLLSHSLREVNAAVLKNSHVSARTLIYDAGTTVHDTYIPTHDSKVFRYKGRTDYMVAKTWKDIEHAHTIHTLLLHASDPSLAFHKLGQDFMRDFVQVLMRHRAIGLLGSKTFVHEDASTSAEDKEYARILNLITERKTRDAEAITKATQVIRGNKVVARDIANIATYSIDPKEREAKEEAVYASMAGLLTVEVSALIDDYRAKLYPDGVYKNEFDS